MSTIAMPSARPRPGPRASDRRGYRLSVELPQEPAGYEILAAVADARQRASREHAWDGRLETSCIAVTRYLWRRGRGERWAGAHGSARYACSLPQLVLGLAPIVGWPEPDRRNPVAVARFVRAHRKSVQRWLDWLQLAGLVSHAPQRDSKGFWWRTVLTLHACPALTHDQLQEALGRRAGWNAREARRRARGRRRNLTVILRRAHLTAAQKRSRGIARRRACRQHAERVRVRLAILKSLCGDLTLPFGAEATLQSLNGNISTDEPDRRTAQASASTAFPDPSSTPDPTAAGQKWGLRGPHGLADPQTPPEPQHRRSDVYGEADMGEAGEEMRWRVYNEVAHNRLYRCTGKLESTRDWDAAWTPAVARQAKRLAELAAWPDGAPAPERWRLIEAWAVAAHGPQMTAAGAFRLAFWSEHRPKHGPRLNRALERYERNVDARPPGWPPSPIAAFARYLAEHVRRQDGPEHGMAVDVAHFNTLTKQMAAYRRYTHPAHLERLARRAQRRQQLRQLADQVNNRLQFRADRDANARLKAARELLNSPSPTHQGVGSRLYAQAALDERLVARDHHLLAGRHPGLGDGGYLSACVHAERWNLPAPPAEHRSQL